MPRRKQKKPYQSNPPKRRRRVEGNEHLTNRLCKDLGIQKQSNDEYWEELLKEDRK